MTSTNATAALAAPTAYTYTPNTTGATGATAGASGTAAPSGSDQQDRFLKLLVAQLNNQDPMNPMDNAQMTSQIAQINTVTGIQQLNATVTSLSTQFAAMQGLQASTLIGHDVVFDGNSLTVDPSTKSGSGSFDLAGSAGNVSVDITTASGAVVGTVPLGTMDAGRHDFKWDTSAYAGTGPLTFKVNAANGTTPVSSTPLVQNKVVSVGSDAGNLNLRFADGTSAPYSGVRSIL
jgi:flagellar basal-body rod modification protein FlgD